MKEEHIQSGAIKDIPDARDYQWSEIGKTSEPFDWNKGYDVESDIGYIIPIKAQGQSSSCGGQAFSYYAEVLELINSKTFEERSAKFLYSQCFLNGGGSRARDICKILSSQGDAREALFPSYDNEGNPLSEEEYQSAASLINSIIRNDAKSAMAISYVNVNTDIDTVAQAIRDNHGVVLGLTGESNGTWMKEYPSLPTKEGWNHFVYAGRAKLINGKKYIGILNSWGEDCGNGGWQWIGEDYFNLYLNYKAIWQCWTIVIKKADERNNLLKTLLLTLLNKLKLL